MEIFWKQFCNGSELAILNEYEFSNNRSIYFLHDCFQEYFVVTPLYLINLFLCVFYLAFYSSNASFISNSLRQINLTLFGRYATISALLCVQLSLFFLQDFSTNLPDKVVILVKVATIVAYLTFLLKSRLISCFDKQFKLLKVAVFLLYLISLSECLTRFFTTSHQILFTLSAITSSLWFLHFFFLLKSNSQITPQLLINDETENTVALTGEQHHFILSRILFTWVTPLFGRGLESKIQTCDDLFDLPYSLSPQSVLSLSDSYLNPEQNSLIRFLLKEIAWQLAAVGCLKLFTDFLSFMSPIFLNKLLLYLESDRESYRGFGYATVLFGSTLSNALLVSYFNFQMIKISLRIRTFLITTIYHKLFRVKHCSLLGEFSTGQVLNLANTDIDRVINFMPSLFQFISLPIQLLVTLYLLYAEVGLVFLSGVAFIIILIPINKIIANKIGSLSKNMMEFKDRRIKILSQILKGIRTIKMHHWHEAFIDRVQYFRTEEVKYLKWRKYLDALCVYFWATTPVIISSLVFGTYAYVNGTESLTSSKVFTSLALLSMLIMPLNALPWVLNGLIEALVSVRRLDKFLKLVEMDPNTDYGLITESSDIALELKRFSFSYSDRSSFKLRNLDVLFPQKSLTGIIGRVGSGKSSLLKSMLNELNKISGDVRLQRSLLRNGIGYVSQEPWIQNSTIEENILFGKEYDAERYHMVIDACALSQDFHTLTHGDKTLVGDHGATLSGGQRSRISLARALYQDFDLYLIDEPFASVDVHVAREIYQKCFKDLLRDKCVILVTNHVQYLVNSRVICLDQGSYSIVNLSDELAQNLAKYEPASVSQPVKSVDAQVEQEEEREYGVVKFSIYMSYVHSIGYFVFTVIIVSIVLMQTSKSASDFWLSLWTQPKKSFNSLHYLYIFIAIAFVNSLITLVRAFIFAYGGVCAAVTLHDQLLKSIFHTTLTFFDLTSFGIIINRFSSDTFNVDDALPFTLNIFLAQLSGLIASLVVTIFGLPWIFIIIIPLALPYFYIQKYFRCTSRELKRLSAVSLSPIYSLLDDTIQGLVTIRSFVQTDRFKRLFYDKVTVYNRIQYAVGAVQQWLNLRLQLLGVMVTSGVAMIAVYLHYYHFENVDSGFVGLSLVYSLSLTALLNGTVQTFTQTELDLISVERIMQMLKCIEMHSESGTVPLTSDHALLDPYWPSEGTVRFSNVCMRYRDDQDLVLNNVNFETSPGEHVAIVGRTGSGKSSLFQALFRLTNIESGTITIDNIDIYSIDVEILRSNIFVIPQEPFLHSGSIRDNLDPLCQYRDDELWTALYSCSINILVDSLGGLDAELNEGGSDLSVGQRHLFCLARAVLAKRNILCMDEVTANIDTETESVLHDLLSSVFKYTTVLHIAHKPNSIRNFHRVIVMDEGRVVECTTVDHYLSHQ